MRKIDAVVGAHFGDEGKGKTVAFLATPETTVVRYSGGANAGHTVQLRDGRRHVFSHIGSGTFSEAGTYLSRYFYCDPVLFNREYDALAAIGVTPFVQADPNAPVVTPFDVILNQLQETLRQRQKAEHGSCGCGVGMAAHRHEERPEKLVVADLESPLLRDKLRAISSWAIGVAATMDTSHADLLQDFTAGIARFMEAVPKFLDRVHQRPWRDLKGCDHFLFEGSQGLLLDREIGVFPHVTRASTGLPNIVKLLQEQDLDPRSLTVYAASRCYLTRHGAGPLPGESCGELVQARLRGEDRTNVPNPWQGTLRYAPFDDELYVWSVWRMLAQVDGQVPHSAVKFVVTCLDQIDGVIPVVNSAGNTEEQPASWFTAQADLTSWGPCVDDMREER